MISPRSFRRSLSTLALVAGLTTILSAQVLNGTQFHTGTQSVPPNGLPGSGPVTVSVDTGTNTVTISGSYFGMSANVTAVHMHQAPPGSNGPIIIPLGHTGGTAGTFSGSAILGAAQVATIVAGGSYVNIHTAANPGGESRANVKVPWEMWSPGSPCASGAIPMIDCIGPFTSGSTNSLDLSGAPAGAPAWLVVGAQPLRAPFKGGILGPNPTLILGPFSTAADGSLDVPYVLPTLPAGVMIWAQYWVREPGTTIFCSTKTIKGTTM